MIPSYVFVELHLLANVSRNQRGQGFKIKKKQDLLRLRYGISHDILSILNLIVLPPLTIVFSYFGFEIRRIHSIN